MKKILFAAVFTAFLFVQCGKDKDPYLITDGALGNLTKEIQMKQVDSIFAQDSIVKLNPVGNTIGTQGEVEIYDKEGNKLILLSPEDENDPNSTITNIQIYKYLTVGIKLKKA